LTTSPATRRSRPSWTASSRSPAGSGGALAGRATWLRLHEALTDQGEVGYSLDDLADDHALARSIFPE
jgi:hypothetical protein